MKKVKIEELLTELNKIKKKIGRTPQQKDITEHGVYSINAYKRAFGGLNKALILIGETPQKGFGYSKEDVFSELTEILEKLGRYPSSIEFSVYAKLDYKTARKIMNNITWADIVQLHKIQNKEII